MKILVSAGEKSGDEHAAKVIYALKLLNPEVSVRGMGGSALRETGAQIDVDSEASGSVMGFWEVIKNLKKIYQSYKILKNLLTTWKPDVVLLVDYAEFNMHLATACRKAGVKVYHFIPPQAWAWRKYRVKRMKRDLSGMGVLFPFEKDFYENEGVKNVTYVGHPFLEELKNLPSKDEARRELGIKPYEHSLILFPGSRTQEINLHFPVMKEVAFRLKEKYPELKVLLSATEKFKFEEPLPDWFIVVRNKQNILLRAGDFGIIKSGTSNLQAALCGLPFVMVYKTSKISYFIAQNFIRIPFYSIVNILRNNTVPEVLQDDFNVENLFMILEQKLQKNVATNEQTKAFAEILKCLNTQQLDSGEAVACEVMKLF